MKSYSKIIKASNLSIVEEVKIFSQPLVFHREYTNNLLADEQPIENENRVSQIEAEIIREANEKAKSIIKRAEDSARSIEETAQVQVNKLWEAFQEESENLKFEAKEQGYQDGFEIGKKEAESRIELEYSGLIEQAKNLLDQAFEQKEIIISEAEPFLLELSTSIASQIIKQELTDYPDKFVGLIKQHILRIKEREYVSVCVHPDDYEFMQSQRAQLVAVVNGETEIKIIPDPSVSQKGCVIRTEFGSVDARIDIQIEGMKKLILDARRRGRESGVNS